MMSNWKFFIARRIYRSREGEKEVSKPAVRIAMAGIAIGLAVMIVSKSSEFPNSPVGADNTKNIT